MATTMEYPVRRSGAGDFSPLIGRLYASMREILKGEGAMDKAFRNSLFLTGLPLAICGIAITAPGLWIPGLVFMVIGWANRDTRA
jgi:hypothetical protein